MFKSHNAYSILGLKENANSNSVRQAYHEQALRNHPDKGGDPDRMKSINAAYYTLLQQIEEQTVNSDFLDKSMEKLNEILKRKIPEHIRDDVDEASNKHRELHSAFVEQFKQDDIKRISAYTHFKKFKTNLYYDITLDNNEVCIVSYEDLFDLVSQKKLLTEHKKLEQLPNAISPQIAVEIFIKFIEGACFGYNLIAAKCLINAQLKITNKTEPTYNLYSGILEILNMEEINSGQEGDLLKSLNKITDFARDQPEQTMPYFAPLLQNIYFRTLFSQALHLFWQEHSRNFKETDRTILNNLKMTKNYLSVLAKRVLDNDKNGIEDNNVLTVTAVVKKLYEFELFINKEMDKSHTDGFYRELGFSTLSWCGRLNRYVTDDILVNVFIQAGTYFQQASCTQETPLNIKKADEKLALHAYSGAILLSDHGTPDLKIYTLINCLKFISAFNYQDDDVAGIINAIQIKISLLVDLFPVHINLQANMDLLLGHKQTLGFMRRLLHTLVSNIEQNKLTPNQPPSTHEYVAVLYQAYEASLKNWYQGSSHDHDPTLENKFRLELMRLLLKNSNWKFEDIYSSSVQPVTFLRDSNAWINLTEQPEFNNGPQSFASFDGVEINNNTGEVTFLLRKSENKNTFTMYDLKEIIERNIHDGIFSLDPVTPLMKYHPFNAMRFEPQKLYNTQFLNTMLLTDYILKFLTVGQEVQGSYPYNMRPIQAAITNLPEHLRKIIDTFLDNSTRYNHESLHRFWIEAEQVTFAKLDDDGSGMCKIAISDIKMVVKKHVMERDLNGNLKDTKKDHEGWDLYILITTKIEELTEQSIVRTEIDNPINQTIKGPAIVFEQQLDGSLNNKVFLMGKHGIYRSINLSSYDAKLTELATYKRESNGKIIITTDNSMFIYRIIEHIATTYEEPTYFSPEYVFAQEFTAHYDEFSEHILEFARLKELSKITVLNMKLADLNMKLAEAEQKLNVALQLLRCIPDWEERNIHGSKNSDYFDLPSSNANLTVQEKNFASFRNKNATLIKSMLPGHLYKKYSDIFTNLNMQIKASMVTIFPNESQLQKLYEEVEKKTRQTYGEEWWNTHKTTLQEKIWEELSNKAKDEKTSIITHMRKQLYDTFSEKLKSLTENQLYSLIDKTLNGDITELAEELAKQELIVEKQELIVETEKLRQIINDSKRLLGIFKNIALDTQKEPLVELDQECLWIPASVRHDVTNNNSLLVYGGVRVMPIVKNLDSSNAKLTQQNINNIFNRPNITRVSTAEISGAINLHPQQAQINNTRMTTSSYQVTSSNGQSGVSFSGNSSSSSGDGSSSSSSCGGQFFMYRKSNASTNSNNSKVQSSTRMKPSSFTDIFTKKLNHQGFQEHHIISDKNKDTLGTVAKAFELAGLHLDSRINKMFLPNQNGLHPTRSIHRGRHYKVVNEALEKRLKSIIERGQQEGWGQNEYRKAVEDVIVREGRLLKFGHRSLNRNRTEHARPHSHSPSKRQNYATRRLSI